MQKSFVLFLFFSFGSILAKAPQAEWAIIGGSRNVGYGFAEHFNNQKKNHTVLIHPTDAVRCEFVFMHNNYSNTLVTDLCGETESFIQKIGAPRYIVYAPEFDFSVWEDSIIKSALNTISAAEHCGAMIVFPSRIFNFGLQEIITEESIPKPNSEQGRVLQIVEDLFTKAAQEGRCKVRIIRHGYPFGPGIEDGLLSRSFRVIPQTGPFTWIYCSDKAQQFVYNIDIAQLAELFVAHAPEEPLGIVNFGGKTWQSVEAFGKQIAYYAKMPYQARILGEWELFAMSMFNANVNRGRDLAYAFTNSILLDDSKRKSLFPLFKTTATESAILHTLNWYATQKTRGLVP